MIVFVAAFKRYHLREQNAAGYPGKIDFTLLSQGLSTVVSGRNKTISIWDLKQGSNGIDLIFIDVSIN